MTHKEMEIIDKEITDLRIKAMKGIDKAELDQALYNLQITIFKMDS